MAKLRESSGNMQVITPGERRSGFFGSFIMPLLIIIVILLVTIFFIVKTDGGKKFIVDRMGKSLRMDVELGETRIGWPYILVLDGVSVKEKEASEPALTAESIRVFYDLKLRRHVSVSHGELILKQNNDDDWTPDVFSRFGDIPSGNIAQLAKILDLFDRRDVIDLIDVTIKWIDKSGNENSSVSIADFKTVPVKISLHKMRYFDLAIKSGMVKEKEFSDVKKEWLASEKKPYLSLDEDDCMGSQEWGGVVMGDSE